MRHNKNNKLILRLLTVVTALGCVSCQDDAWDNHNQSAGNSHLNLMETLRQSGHHTLFTKLLEQSGADSLLELPQTFTVFAPTDEALQNFTLDSTVMHQLVKNHIARYIYGRNDLADTTLLRMKMLNNKYQELALEKEGMTFAGIAFDNSPLAAKNGVIYSLNQKANYYDNLWEVLQNQTGVTDSVYAYLRLFNDTTTTKSAFPVGENKKGQTLYFRNRWMSKYGMLLLEDSVYSMIIPTNHGWENSYRQIAPYFRTFGALVEDKSASATLIVKRTYETGTPLSDSLQDAHTRETLLHDLVFRKKVNFASVAGDSLTSTGGNVFHHPSYLIQDMEELVASNGRYYLAEKLNHRPTESFFKTIKIEAEQSSGRGMNYATLTKRSVADTPYKDQVSEMNYIEVMNTSTNVLFQPQVSFDIPNTLAAAYDIYAVFVPACAFDTCAIGYRAPDTLVVRRDTVIGRINYTAGDTALIQYPYYDADSTTVCFYLNYVHEELNKAGLNMYEDNKISADPDGNPFVTHGYAPTKFLVARHFRFPFANYKGSAFSGEGKQTTNVKLRVCTNLTNKNKNDYSFVMRLDYLLFEPVEE